MDECCCTTTITAPITDFVTVWTWVRVSIDPTVVNAPCATVLAELGPIAFTGVNVELYRDPVSGSLTPFVAPRCEGGCDNRPRNGWAFDTVSQPFGAVVYCYAQKTRIQLPQPRRFCVQSCLRMGDIFFCGRCDAAAGNFTQTLLPEQASLIVLPEPYVFGRPGNRDFTFKGVQFDTVPPSSPFCGLP